MVTTLLVLTLLAQDPPSGDSQAASDYSYEAQPPPAYQPPAYQAPGTTKFRGALELSAYSMPSGTPGGAMDVFALALPILAVDSGEDFGFELGAELRLRVFDEPPLQRDEDFRGVLRGRDWDETSDFGQVLRRLRVGSEAGPVYVRAGRMELKTVGFGHLVSRYNNQLNPDYHPASAFAVAAIGPTRTELFASDILAGRIFAGEVSLDIGRTVSQDNVFWDRYHFALSAAHDFGRAGGASPAITLVHVDADAIIYRAEHVRVSGYAGGGTRLFGLEPEVGAVAGFAANGDVNNQMVTLGGRLEGRKQRGGFRHGMFGPAYELSRFSGVGFTFAPVARESLPDSFSGFGEFEVGYGPAAAMPEGPLRLFASLAAEYFIWGRLDGDASISARFPGNKGSASVRFTMLDALGRAPRYQGTGEVRYRFTPVFYVVASGGTIFFPQPGGTLVRGAFGSIGLGMDMER